MRNTRLSALLMQHGAKPALESDAPAEAVAEETPAAPAEEIPAAEEAPAAPAEEIPAAEEAPAAPAAEETPTEVAAVEEPAAAEAPAEEAPAAPAAEETPAAAVAAVETAPTEEVVVETPADLPSDLPADAVVEPAPVEGEQVVAQESLLAVAAIGSAIALIAGLSYSKAARLKNEFIELRTEIVKKRAQLDHLIVASETEARLALKKQQASNESVSEKIDDLNSGKFSAKELKYLPAVAGLGAGALFAVGSPVLAVVSAGLVSAALLANIVAVKKAKAELAALEVKMSEKELEIIKLSAEAESKGVSVSQEAVSEISDELLQCISSEGEGTEEIPLTPAEDAAQGEAEAAVDAQAQAEEAAPVVEETASETTETPAAPAAEEAPAQVAPAQEAAAEEAAAEEAPTGPVDDTEVNEALAAQAEAEGEVKETDQAHSQLQRAASNLESIALSMESALNDGGLHPQAARFMHIAVESQLNAIGMDQPVIPSMESFGGMSARMRATQVSLEGVKETLLKVWEQIVAMLKKMRDAVIAFFKRVFTSVGALRAYLEKLEQKLEEKSDKTSTVELSVPNGIAQRLQVGGKLPRNLADAIENVVSLALDSTEFDKEVAAQLEKDHDAVVDAFVTGDAEAAAKTMKDFTRAPKGFAPTNDTSVHTVFGNVSEGAKVLETKELPGGVHIAMLELSVDLFGNTLNVYKAASVRAKSEIEGDVKYPMLKKSDIKAIISASKQACVAVGAMEHIANGELKSVDAALNDLKGGFKADGSNSQVNSLLLAYRQRAKTFMALSQRIAGHAVTTATAAAKLANLAVDQLEAK